MGRRRQRHALGRQRAVGGGSDWDYNSASSLPSQGCLVLPADALEEMRDQTSAADRAVVAYNNAVAAYNSANDIPLPPIRRPAVSFTVQSPDNGTPTRSLSAITASVGPNQFAKLKVSISQSVSKDVWVFRVFVTCSDNNAYLICEVGFATMSYKPNRMCRAGSTMVPH